jgi:hypothetical protein
MKSDRKNKATNQQLYLIELIPTENKSEKNFAVMGSTGNVYKVTIKDLPECTCPDYRLRSSRCKHIYFILMRVMKFSNVDDEIYDEKDLKQMYDNIPHITRNLIVDKKIRENYKKLVKIDDDDEKSLNNSPEGEELQKVKIDDVCPICLEDLQNGQELDRCKKSCGKYIHKICFSMWCKKNTAACVFCREEWHKKVVLGKNEINYGKNFNYVNVLKK